MEIDSDGRFDIVAKTFRGLEELLAGEIRSIGGADISRGTRAVFFRGDKELLYRANFHLRTALRVLVPFHTFSAKNETELYKGACDFDWSKVLSVNNTFAIDGTLKSPYFNHSGYIALRVKDALADQFMASAGKRPNVSTADPDIRINLHISDDRCTLLLDSSGESLHKRGYRTESGPAPLNEVLAAGMIMLTGWDGKSPFIDPMCGSGTIPIEAAMIAHNIPPGIYRKQFGFEKWPDFDKSLLDKIYNEEYPEPNHLPHITGSDLSPVAISNARKNAKNAFMRNKIDFTISPFEETIPSSGAGVLLVNPPYGERLKKENIRAFYTLTGDVLKNKYSGYTAWILTSNLEAVKYIGLRPEKKILLFNGPLECRLLKYSLYSGSRKQKGKHEAGY